MREIDVQQITDAVAELCMEANYSLPDDVIAALTKAREDEVSPVGKAIFDDIFENLRIAENERLPICQDCGAAVLLVEVGQAVHITGGSFNDALNEGVRRGYEAGYLRKSMTFDPVLTRANTGDNTPAVIHTDIVPGDTIKILFCPKGGGCENMSTVRMMTPADGMDGVKAFVRDFVRDAGGNPCPPGIVGVGIGGSLDKAALLAKKAVLRSPLGRPNPDENYAHAEAALVEEINKLGIGPMGLGGRVTVLAVHIEVFAAHLASMPVAINMNCHAARQRTVVL